MLQQNRPSIHLNQMDGFIDWLTDVKKLAL